MNGLKNWMKTIRDRRAPAARAQAALLRQAAAHRRERDVPADEGRGMTVWIYINTAMEVGDVDHLMGILPSNLRSSAGFG